MPIVDGKLIEPDDAIHRGLCPECGAQITPRTALAHARSHWNPDRSDLSEEARRRFNLLREFSEMATPKPRPKGDGESRQQGVSMGGAEKNSSENAAFLIIAQIAIAGIVEAAMWTLVGDLPRSVLWATVCIGSFAILAINFRERLGSYKITFTLTHLMVTLLALSVISIPLYGLVRWAIWPSNIDSRLAPFAEKSRFFMDLPTDDPGTFTMLCFPFDSESPSSCEIALRYQDALGKYWRPGEFDFDQQRFPKFQRHRYPNGIRSTLECCASIETAFQEHRYRTRT
jgi:hypothetical protein